MFRAILVVGAVLGVVLLVAGIISGYWALIGWLLIGVGVILIVLAVSQRTLRTRT